MSEEADGPTPVDEGPAAPVGDQDVLDDIGVPDGEAPDIYGVIGYCLSLLATEAWHNLGLLADPQTGEAVMDLVQAKVAIDAVGDLAARLDAAPADAVPPTLRRDLKTLLNDLRLNYVSRQGDPSVSRS